MGGLFYAGLSASVAAVIILILRAYLKDKLFAKVFVMLWMFVIIRLLLPFEFSSPLSIWPSPYESPLRNEISVPFITAEENPFEENLPVSESPHAAEKNVGISSSEIITAVWLGGSVLVFGYITARHIYNIKKLLRGSVPAKDIPEEFRFHNIMYYNSKNLASPLSFGLIKPNVILPETIEKEQLPFVLVHENTHIKDGDAVLKALSVLALSLHWFNPIVWVAVHYLERDIERFCDERVLEFFGKEKAAFYANSLLDFAEAENLLFQSSFSAASLGERVVSIMKNKNKKKNPAAALAAILCLVLIMAACGTVPKAEKPVIESEPLSKEETDANLPELLEEKSDEEFVVVIDPKTGTESIAEKIDEELQSAIESEEAPGFSDVVAMEFVLPCEAESAYIACEFRGYKGHTGLDIGSLKGKEASVFAAADGTVTEVNYGKTGHGYYIIIDHGNGYQTLYSHCSKMFVNVNDIVKAGDKIAKMGSTGNSTGIHLHFEIRHNEKYLDPENYLSF